MGFLDNYEDVATRIPRFWNDHPEGRITTDVVQVANAPGERWIVKAYLFRGPEETPFATGVAFEVDGQGNVNKTSALENCETSAIGRALANAGYVSQGSPRPSRQEMGKVGIPPCPSCGSDVWDNRAKIASGEFKPDTPKFTCKKKCGWKSNAEPSAA